MNNPQFSINAGHFFFFLSQLQPDMLLPPSLKLGEVHYFQKRRINCAGCHDKIEVTDVKPSTETPHCQMKSTSWQLHLC